MPDYPQFDELVFARTSPQQKLQIVRVFQGEDVLSLSQETEVRSNNRTRITLILTCCQLTMPLRLSRPTWASQWPGVLKSLWSELPQLKYLLLTSF
jgi:hypothetical protein